MSRIVDVSDPSKLTEDELRYALDRHMITDEQFEEAMGNLEEGDDDNEYDSWTAKQVKEEYDRRVAAGRELPEAKNKKDAIAALVADDEAQES